MLKTMMRFPQRVLLTLVRAYRLLLKPWIGNVCRFEPSCSAYTLQALQEHGAWAGSALGGWRLLRCQPWCRGGADPVPRTLSNPALGLFTRLMPRPENGSAPLGDAAVLSPTVSLTPTSSKTSP